MMCSGTLWEIKASSLLCVCCPGCFEPARKKKKKNSDQTGAIAAIFNPETIHRHTRLSHNVYEFVLS